MRAPGSGKDSGIPRTKKMFKKGDFVRVNNSTHDPSMPASRLGHILEEFKAIMHYTVQEPQSTGVWKVLMANGKILRFHEMFLEKVDENKSR